MLSECVSCEYKIIDCTRNSSDSKIVIVPELYSKIEEADQRLIPHIHYSVSQGAKRSAVISNNTDVFALLIHYLPDFLCLGLQELWIMFGVGDKTRFLPLHLLLYKIGVPKCKVIYKAHISNGSDSTSKIDSKNLQSMQTQSCIFSNLVRRTSYRSKLLNVQNST